MGLPPTGKRLELQRLVLASLPSLVRIAPAGTVLSRAQADPSPHGKFLKDKYESHSIENPDGFHSFTARQALINAVLSDKVSVGGCVRNVGNFRSKGRSRLLAFPMEFTRA